MKHVSSRQSKEKHLPIMHQVQPNPEDKNMSLCFAEAVLHYVPGVAQSIHAKKGPYMYGNVQGALLIFRRYLDPLCGMSRYGEGRKSGIRAAVYTLG